MKCVVLQNTEGAHLGFMLCSTDLSQSSGDCVFIALPSQAALFDTPEAELLFQRREAGESAWQVTEREPLSVVVSTPGLADELFIKLHGQGTGQWGIKVSSEQLVLGRAMLAKSS